MLNYEEIETRLHNLDPQPTTLADLASASSVLKNLADAEKSRLDALEAQRRSEVLRFWVPVLAPSVTAMALVATLAIQMLQVRTQQVATEDAAWREATKNLTVATGPAVPIGLHQLRSFLHSGRYGQSTREILITLLPALDSGDFQIVLPDVLGETRWSNFTDLARLERDLDSAWTRISDERENASDALAAIVSEPENTTGHASRLQNAQRQLKLATQRQDDVVDNVGLVARGIATFLRANHSTRGSGMLDLKYSDIVDADFSTLPLENADLSYSTFRRANISATRLCSDIVVGAELKPSAFLKSDWTNTAWWRAKQVSPELLDYLQRNFPFRPNTVYAGEKASSAEYATGVSRLTVKNHGG